MSRKSDNFKIDSAKTAFKYTAAEPLDPVRVYFVYLLFVRNFSYFSLFLFVTFCLFMFYRN